jgi:TrmH family RNA methyltransferase
MLPKAITSVQHPLVKSLVALRTEKEERLCRNQVLLVGEKLVREIATTISLDCLLSLSPIPSIRAQETVLVSEEVLRKVTGVPNPDGIAAVAPLPPPSDLAETRRLLILDQIADPGNLGTLLRTALALGWDGVAFTPGTVDPFNDKALRSAKGALFFLPYCFATPEDLLHLPHHPWLADLTGVPLNQAQPHSPFSLILSNEGAGPSPWAEKVGQKITIPMHNSVESLNVAASGAIFLYELR